jgi:hypothetical protein
VLVGADFLAKVVHHEGGRSWLGWDAKLFYVIAGEDGFPIVYWVFGVISLLVLFSIIWIAKRRRARSS